MITKRSNTSSLRLVLIVILDSTNPNRLFQKVLTNKRLFFLPLLIILQTSLTAQIHGVVLDAQDRTPISYTTIAFEGLMQGTISNEEGRFILPQMKEPGKALVFSHINYRPYRILYQEAIGLDSITVLLERANYEIDEITVFADEIANLLRRSIELSRETLSQKFVAKTYLREFVKENDQYTKYADGLLSYYIDNWDAKPNSVFVQVNQSRAYEIKVETDEINFDQTSPFDLRMIFEIANPEYLNRITEKEELYDFSIESRSNQEELITQIINFHLKERINKALFQGSVIIDGKTGLIKNFHLELINDQFQDEMNFIVFRGKITNHEVKVNYAGEGDQYFPVYTSLSFSMNFWNNKNLNSSLFFKSDCLINQVLPEEKNPISRKDNYRRKSLYRLGTNYSTNFWEEQDVLSLTKDEKRIIESLEQ